MKSFYKALWIVSVTLIWLPTSLTAADNLRQLRFLSFAIRDMPPSYDEVQAFVAGERTLASLRAEWLDSEVHLQTVGRYFNDMFLMNTDMNAGGYSLSQNDDGIYHFTDEADCTLAQAVDTPAWFVGDASTTVKACPREADTEFFYDDKPCATYGHYQDARCGCGPHLVFCIPETHLDTGFVKANVRAAMQYEFRDRGIFAYQQDWTWFELLGSDKFYGNRFLYWLYLFKNAYETGLKPEFNQDMQDELYSYPTTDFNRSEGSYPNWGMVRGGVPTMIQYLKTHNNFRTRIRKLTLELLCQDVDSTLNTAPQISSYLNTDFSDFDRDHGQKTGCADCHFPMDNMGSTLFGFDVAGNPMTKFVSDELIKYDTTGYAFGENGAGPSFLIQGYIERGPGFHSCMAKKAWEFFSGLEWSDLDLSVQDDLIQAADRGPRPLLREVLSSDALVELRATPAPSDSDGANPTPAPVVTFAEVTTIVNASCNGGNCHSAGTSLGARYDFSVESTLAAAPAARVSDGTMPPASSGKTLTDADRQKIVDFINQ